MKHVLKVIIDYGDSTEMPVPIEDFQNAIRMLTEAENVTVSEMNKDKKNYDERISQQRMAFIRTGIGEEYGMPCSLMFNVVCEERKIPEEFISLVENYHHLKFKSKDLVYYPWEFTWIQNMEPVYGGGSWQGFTLNIHSHLDKKELVDSMVALPLIIAKDPILLKITLCHELSEILHIQNGYGYTKAHKRALVLERCQCARNGFVTLNKRTMIVRKKIEDDLRDKIRLGRILKR